MLFWLGWVRSVLFCCSHIRKAFPPSQSRILFFSSLGGVRIERAERSTTASFVISPCLFVVLMSSAVMFPSFGRVGTEGKYLVLRVGWLAPL